MDEITDFKQWVAVHTAAIARLLLDIEGTVEDVRGAVADEQWGVAAIQARTTVLQALSVAGMPGGAEIDWDNMHTSHDCFAGVDAGLVSDGMAIARDGLQVRDPAAAAAWVERLEGFVRGVERSLEFSRPLPVVRTRAGLFPALADARQWLELSASIGLPIGAFIQV